MEPNTVLGPPLFFKVVAGMALAGATAGVLVEKGLISLAFAALAVVVAWRLFGLSVSFDEGFMVVRNILRTIRFPVDEIDIRARVVDPRREAYSSGNPGVYEELPTASDDNTSRAAKWYELVHGKDLHSIDALTARSPANHERLALELRQQILAARDVEYGDGSDGRQ